MKQVEETESQVLLWLTDIDVILKDFWLTFLVQLTSSPKISHRLVLIQRNEQCLFTGDVS